MVGKLSPSSTANRTGKENSLTAGSGSTTSTNTLLSREMARAVVRMKCPEAGGYQRGNINIEGMIMT
jgi:hypothetical protein